MDYIIIEVPDINDSVSRIVLQGTAYYIRFTYNDTEDRWRFGLYDAQMQAIVQGVKIVPGFPLNLFKGRDDIPNGIFICLSNADTVGRNDFADGRARFVFAPIVGGVT